MVNIFFMTGFSSENETLLLILDIYFAQAFVTVHCHLIRCSGKYHNLCEAGEIKKPTMELPGVNKKQAPLLAKETFFHATILFWAKFPQICELTHPLHGVCEIWEDKR